MLTEDILDALNSLMGSRHWGHDWYDDEYRTDAPAHLVECHVKGYSASRRNGLGKAYCANSLMAIKMNTREDFIDLWIYLIYVDQIIISSSPEL